MKHPRFVRVSSAAKTGENQPNFSGTGRRPWFLATLAMVSLGLGFFLIYGACNEITAHRANVGSFYFAWERLIPFVPVMIVPYMSVDLFFCGSFYLCHSRAELGVFSRRIVLAFALSAAGFLLFPLRYAWPRPEVDGWLGALFAPLNAMDKPFNLCPSLHISLRTLCWTAYGRHTRGPLREALKLWFFLIGLSTLLVYQHHFIDLLGGWAVAILCCATFRERSPANLLPWPRALWSALWPTPSSPPCSSGRSGSSPAPASGGLAAGRTTGSDSGSISPTTPLTWTP